MNAIVAVDRHWGIGQNNQLLVRIPADLQRFKALTTGHPVILGRKTLETFPGGRPLPGRRNLILSTNPDYHVEGGEVFHSPEELLQNCPDDAFVIGGSSVYKLLLPRCQRVYVTVLSKVFPADAFFPDLEKDPQWRITETQPPLDFEGLSFQYVTYDRV
ncbi:MAG: dihydrofolate reductase [Oscillospiraceae bacterium]